MCRILRSICGSSEFETVKAVKQNSVQDNRIRIYIKKIIPKIVTYFKRPLKEEILASCFNATDFNQLHTNALMNSVVPREY